MSYEPSISLVVPAYANSYFLKETLYSIINQTVLPNETIIVDDCFSSRTSKTLNMFEKSFKGRLKLIVNEENKGITKTTHTALLNTESDYVGLLDSDDLLLPNAIENAKSSLKNQPNAKVYSSDFAYFRNQEETQNPQNRMRNQVMSRMGLKISDWQFANLLTNAISHFKVFQKDLNSCYHINSQADPVADMLFNYQLDPEFEVILDPQVTYLHRYHKNQTTKNSGTSSSALRLLNQSRRNWKLKLLINNRPLSQNHPMDHKHSIFRILQDYNQTSFFQFRKSGDIRFINFDSTSLDDALFIGCYPSKNFDSDYFEKGLLRILKNSVVPVGLFSIAANLKNRELAQNLNGLFDFIAIDDERLSSLISGYVPDQIPIY